MTSEGGVKCHPSWTQTGSNTYTQPYGFQEVLYNAITVPPGSPGLFLIGSSVTFSHIPSSPGNELSTQDLVPLLRKAWLQLRQQYPTLAAENHPNGKTYTSPLSSVEFEAWLDETFIVTPGKTSVEHWKTMVKTSKTTLHFFPEERQLFMQGEHHILDGRGVMNFWDRFFKFLASPAKEDLLKKTYGSEIARLPPRSDDLLDMKEIGPGRGEQRALEILAPLTTMQSPITVPVPRPLPPCSTRNAALEFQLSARTTGSIIAACKAQRLSVTAAWHAAVVLATQTIQAQRNSAASGGTRAEVGKQFAAFGNFDLRRYFPVVDEAVLPDAYALSNHHGVLPYVVEPDGKNFPEIARELAAFYQQDLPKADAEVWSALGPMIRTMVPEFTVAQLEETTPALSSLGVVDNFIGSSYTDVEEKGIWRIEEVWFGDTVTGPWLECFMWAWQGRLSVNTCFNPAYYTRAEVNEWNQLVLEKMLNGLGILGRSSSSKL
ncbi:hypothetical protein BKA67DRAFT_518160 [Truncatella angustata]|uniref:Uncharacterized protein n=1 Tax=Truncatella angustata TaxID=152316 RepID=A0A9P8ZZB8_9PEZI|nr:uncharacterized protein BKA67DRAFT_518160 [Truncatella angustata]KAH6654891.1 hypothetical protein BKA67DRAFT_518160 [Truncatella angustata]